VTLGTGLRANKFRARNTWRRHDYTGDCRARDDYDGGGQARPEERGSGAMDTSP
jgi:hypothetical protein